MVRIWIVATIYLGGAAALVAMPPAHNVVGTVPGIFNVSLTGSSQYSIPIKVAPGTAGVEPKLSLVYDSQAPAGAIGAGWSLSGISAITRGPKNARRDGIPDGVRMLESDARYLDGQRLIPISESGSGPTRQVQYRKEVDDQTRIVENGTDFATATFTVNTKGGLRIDFNLVAGTSPTTNRGDIRFSDGTVLLRAASRLSDTAGNYLDFYYVVNGDGNYDIQTIRYTGHVATTQYPASQRDPYAEVNFTYEPAPRAIQTYVAGHKLIVDTRLKSIIARVADDASNPATATWLQVARYTLDYTERDTANRFLLAAVHEFGEDDGELTPARFSYAAPALGWADPSYTFPGIFAAHQELATGYRFAHVSADAAGLPDILYAAKIGGQIESFSFQNNGTSWSAMPVGFKPPVPFTQDDGSDLGVIVADVDGDGRADILQSYQSDTQAPVAASYTAGATGWVRQTGFDLPFVVSKDGKTIAKFRMQRWSGGPGPDLIYQSAGSMGFLVNTVTGWKADNRYAPPIDLGDSTWVVDVDCSGKPSLIGAVSSGGGSHVWKVFRYGIGGWEENTASEAKFPFSADIDPAAIRVLSVDNTSCPAVLVATAQNGGAHAMYQASAAGWTPLPSKAPPFDLVDAAGIPSLALVAKLNSGDLPAVFANRTFADGHAVKFMYFQTATGWLASSNTYSLPVLNSPMNSQGVVSFVGDITGTGATGIAIAKSSRQSFGQVYVSTTTGFVEQTNFIPPVAFARKDHQDLGARLVDLNGDGLPDLLINRADDASPGAWINTGSGWTSASGLVPTIPFAGKDISGSPVQFVDVDGDGFVDLLYSYRGKNGVETHFLRNVDVGGTRKWSEVAASDPQFGGLVPPSNYPFAADQLGDLGVRFADLSGSGRAYMMVGFQPAGGSPQLTAFRNDGQKWVPAPEFAPPVPFVAQFGTATDPGIDLSVQIVDVNGDGLPDIVANYHDPTNPSQTISGVWLNTGRGWAKDNSIQVPVPLDGLMWVDNVGLQLLKNASIQWTDVNGDGLLDIVYLQRNGSTNNSVTYLGTGHGWIATPKWQVPLDALADRSGDSGLRIIDVNGDGYPDLYFARQESDGSIAKGIYINDGTTWIPKAKNVVPDIPFVDKDGNDLGVRMFDIEGKGLVDLVQAYSGDTNQAAIKINQVRRADVIEIVDSGDGLVTTVAYQTLAEQSLPLAGQPTLPSAFAWPRVYERGISPSSYPILAPTPPAYVVRRAIVAEGTVRQTAFSYRYGDYRMDALAKASLGFRWRETVNEQSGLLTHADLSQDPDYAGFPLREETCWLKIAANDSHPPTEPGICDRMGAVGFDWVHTINRTESHWTVETGAVGGGTLPAGTIRHVLLGQTDSVAFELDGHLLDVHSDTFSYDEDKAGQPILDKKLNVTTSATTWNDGASIVTKNEYSADDSSRWFLGRLTKSTITKSAPTVPAAVAVPIEVRVAGFAYDAINGLLESETRNFGSAKAVTTKYERDAFGNIISKSVHAADVPDHAPSKYGYDNAGRFQIQDTDALGHSTFKEYFSASGLVRLIKDQNGITESFEYDGIGRLKATTQPTGNGHFATTTSIWSTVEGLDVSIPVKDISAVYAVVTRVSDGQTTLPSTVNLLDAKGRVLRTVSAGFTKDDKKQRPILRDTQYDQFGQVARSSFPFELGHAPLWTTVVRDVLGRVTQRTDPSGQIAKTVFSAGTAGGPSVTTIDVNRNRRTTAKRDMRGHLIESIDAAQGVMRYSYDAGGRQIRVVSPLGVAANYEYDDIGNPKRVRDADAGLWSYEYDSLGRLVRQTDDTAGDAQTIRLEYDELGRLKVETKSQPAEVWTWTYDTSNYGIGRVASIANASGTYEVRYLYDATGRNNEVDTTINKETFNSVVRFDSFGRPVTTQHPQGLVVENIYDSKGYLTAVRNTQTRQEYWRLQATNAYGEVTKAQFGNGILDTRQYEDTTGRPQELKAVRRSGDSVVDLKLRYDLAGNLRRRDESVQQQSEIFGYDQLDRLTSLEKPSGQGDRYDYDVAGRILFKSGVGKFTYASGVKNNERDCGAVAIAAHAVVKTSQSDVDKTFGYDCHGNMIRNGADTYSYSSDNRLIKAEYDPSVGAEQWTTFEYAPDGTRFREVSKHGARQLETLAVGTYERVTEFGMGAAAAQPRFVRNRWYLSNGQAVFAVVETNREEFPAMPGTIFHDGADAIGAAPVESAKTWYLHTDQLGSILAITDENSVVRAHYWYDPWGQRRGAVNDPAHGATSGKRLEDSWNRGFMAQEHIPDLGLIHLNGRVYNPELARFTSADPVQQAPIDSQMWDGYAYGRNNPLRYVDPSGFDLFGDAWNVITAPARLIGNGIQAIGQGIAHLANEVGKFVGENWRQIVVIAAVITVTVLTLGSGGPAAASLGTAILSGMAAGATGGALSAALYGGNLSDVLAGAIKGGVIGAFSGAAFYGVGQLTAGGGTLNNIGAVAGNGVVGGAREAAGGGNFWQGFVSTGVATASSFVAPDLGSRVLNTARAAAVGGAVAAASGGNFVNGAITAAFAYAYGEVLTRRLITINGDSNARTAFNQARAYLTGGDSDADAVFARADAEGLTVNVNYAGQDNSPGVGSHIVNWDPTSALSTPDGLGQSPALGLYHEMVHAIGDPSVPIRPMPRYDDTEEYRVINGYETPAAKALGEGIRDSHGGTPYAVPCATCTH